MIRVVILGSGNVAQHLYTAFSDQKTVTIVQCYNRKGIQIHKDQKNTLITDNLEHLIEADIYIIAVSDDVIAQISEKLPFRNRLVVHTSGSVHLLAISSKNRRGVYYPLQTFSKDKKINYSKIPFCIEAENETDSILLKKLAAIISLKIYEITSEQRSALHVAAVFVNNFANYMFTIGNEICQENNIPFEILYPLIQETTKKIEKTPPNNAQTGPAIRGDQQTINKHLQILNNNTQKEVYNILTKAIHDQYGKEL